MNKAVTRKSRGTHPIAQGPDNRRVAHVFMSGCRPWLDAAVQRFIASGGDDRVFIGSFKFDPRSALLNTEIGFLIDSADMAARMSRFFEDAIITVSYQPRLVPNRKMVWHDEQVDGDTITYQQEPGASWFQQVSFAVVGLLPIEWLL